MAGKGTRVFNGKVYVKQDAQRTRAYQTPTSCRVTMQGVHQARELEIYADDVKCSHGAPSVA